MRKFVALLAAVPLALVLSAPTFAKTAKKASSVAKEHVYYGNISDSMCGTKLAMSGDPHECTLKCVKDGAKYVFVSRGKILEIANQDLPDLEKYAGDHVKVTATRKSNTLTIASLTPVTPRKMRAKAKKS